MIRKNKNLFFDIIEGWFHRLHGIDQLDATKSEQPLHFYHSFYLVFKFNRLSVFGTLLKNF